MSERKPTPGLWRIGECDGEIFVTGIRDGVQLEIYRHKATPIARANARHIVKCVNHFDEMREAIEDEAAQHAYEAGMGVSEWEAFLWPKARAVLAKIEAGE